MSPPPMSDENVDGGDYQTGWLVHNLPADMARLLAEHELWSTPEVSFFVHLMEGAAVSTIPRYLFTLEGFVHNSAPGAVKWATEEFEAGGLYREKILELVKGDKSNARNLDEVASAVLHSLEILVWRDACAPDGTPGRIAANVYGDLQTTSAEVWERWRKELLDVSFEDRKQHYPPRAALLDRCAVCRGADHRMTACKYPQVPGWNGPTAADAVGRGAMKLNNAAAQDATCGDQEVARLETPAA
ncbi:hypothetical protein GY45DRAFT_1374068 [Cubamyces sp. BRFM 1775]|nr:hypothetical protein GY45DRAFT_1374068 [Cubamyces sp. BRFM 1775]